MMNVDYDSMANAMRIEQFDNYWELKESAGRLIARVPVLHMLTNNPSSIGDIISNHIQQIVRGN
jgi:hypothetical protein